MRFRRRRPPDAPPCPRGWSIRAHAPDALAKEEGTKAALEWLMKTYPDVLRRGFDLSKSSTRVFCDARHRQCWPTLHVKSPMGRIFISHSSADIDQAAQMKAWLASVGFEAAFLDKDKATGIPPGAGLGEDTLPRGRAVPGSHHHSDAVLAGLEMALRRIQPSPGAGQGDLPGDPRADRRHAHLP
jgi:hypothetical protein